MLDKIVIDPNSADFGQYLELVSFVEAQSIKPADAFIESVCEFADAGDQLIGSALPWDKTKNTTRIGKGKLSIWAGAAGSGKSLLLGQVINHMIAGYQQRACIASLEMQPRQTLYRMICQTAKMKADRQFCTRWLDVMKGHLFIYDQLDKVETDRILGMAHYAAHELKCDHIVIDSLTKCGLGRDDYDAQAKFVDRLQWCAKHWGVHIHLVCHMTKANQGGRAGIRGAAEITDLADNVYIISRNREKDVEMEKMNLGEDYKIDVLTEPCCLLRVDKNRDYGHETEFGLYLDRKCGWYGQDLRDINP